METKTPPQTSAHVDEWLTPEDVQRIYKWGKTRFWQLCADRAFEVSRPQSPTGRGIRLVYVRRSDVDSFINSGYPKGTDR